MSYLVLARKWRPHTFSEVVGQEHVTTTLENAIKSDRLASAYVFSGPRGVGKTTTARILAKALNCENGPTITPCNACAICNEITSGNSIDVLEIDGASNRGIDEIRNLRESTRYTSAQQRRKIYIIDEVHMLTTEAFNALLKTLEEPPPHVIFIFATTESNKIPATILSRCQRFDFRRIPVPKIIEQLQKICEAEKINIDQRALYLVASKAEGCMRDSQSLLDQAISFCGMEIKEDDVADLLGIIGADVYIEILNAVANKSLPEILTLSKSSYQKGYSFQQLLNGLAEHVNQVLVFKATQSANFLDENADFAAKFKEQAEKFTETDLIRIYQAVVEAANDLRWTQHPQLHVEMLLARLTQIASTVELNSLLSEIDTLKKKALTGSTPQQPDPGVMRIVPQVIPQKREGGLFKQLNGLKSTPKPSKVEDKKEENSTLHISDQPLKLQDITSKWPEIVAAVKKIKISIGSFLEEGTPAMVSGNQLDIQFDASKSFHIKSINAERLFIQKVLTNVCGKRVLINCQIVKENDATELAHEHKIEVIPPPLAEAKHSTSAVPAQSITHQSPVKKKNDKDWIADYPNVQKLIETFEGEEIN